LFSTGCNFVVKAHCARRVIKAETRTVIRLNKVTCCFVCLLDYNYLIIWRGML